MPQSETYVRCQSKSLPIGGTIDKARDDGIRESDVALQAGLVKIIEGQAGIHFHILKVMTMRIPELPNAIAPVNIQSLQPPCRFEPASRAFTQGAREQEGAAFQHAPAALGPTDFCSRLLCLSVPNQPRRLVRRVGFVVTLSGEP
jgi:hypothetical protein